MTSHQPILNWEEKLPKAQREDLAWLREHYCSVMLLQAPPDALHDLPEGFVLEVLADRHGVLKLRGEQQDIPAMVSRARAAVAELFDYFSSK